MIQGIDHIAVAVSDIPKSVVFYAQVLDMRVVDSSEPETASFYWLNFGAGQTLNLCLNPDETPKAIVRQLDWHATPHMAFVTTEDFLLLVESRLKERDVPFKKSKTGLYFTDPDGNFLELTFWREASIRSSGAEHW